MRAVKVAVIVAAYNSESTIKRCIASVQMQKYTRWQMYVVDDGSTDSTGVLLDKMSELDERIHVFHISNGGKRNAHRMAINAAKQSDYIVFLDSDDTFKTANLFSICIKECLQNEVDIVCFNNERNGKPTFSIEKKIKLTKQEEKVQSMFSQKILDGNIWGAFYKYDIVYNEYIVTKYNHEDYINKYKFMMKAAGIVVLPTIGYVYYKQPESITQKNIKEEDYFYFIHAKKFVKSILKKYPDLKEVSDYFLGNILLWTAGKLLQNKQNKKLKMYKPIMKELHQYNKIILFKNSYFSFKNKILFLLMYTRLYYPLYIIKSLLYSLN